MTSYEQGYKAGLNAWPYDLAKVDDKDYNEGWKKGCEKRKAWDRQNGWES